jgi:hypothetical protein
MDNKKQLADAVIKLADGRQEPDGRRKLACADAFDLAERFDVKIVEVGRICNRNNIKICKCPLGCFK